MSSIFNHPYVATLGLYTITCGPTTGPKQDYDRAVTIANIIGWIPIIGTIIGIFRLYVGVTRYNNIKNSDDPNEDEMRACLGLMARGIAEILCLGPLLLLIDIIFTIGRCCSNAQHA